MDLHVRDSSIRKVLGEFASFFLPNLNSGRSEQEGRRVQAWIVEQGRGSGVFHEGFLCLLTQVNFSRNGNDSKTGRDSWKPGWVVSPWELSSVRETWDDQLWQDACSHDCPRTGHRPRDPHSRGMCADQKSSKKLRGDSILLTCTWQFVVRKNWVII